jgi:predicted AlkP superfamily pyrophosphatase or phosphodiesterase
MLRRLLVATLLPLLMTAAVAHAAPQAPKRPKLVVVVVIDQFRRSDLERLAPHMTGGMKRLLSTGAVLDGHYGHQNTYTGPDHALILSGSYGYLNGIIQNKWWNRVAGRSEGMLYDGDAKVLGGKDDPGEDTSPRNFNGSTVGDELRLSNSMASKSVALALKERGALLLGGRLGQAWFFNEGNGEMTTSTYYASELPSWVKAWNAQKLVDQAYGKAWERALGIGAYGMSGPDDSPFEGDVLGLGKTFPHRVTGGVQKAGPKFYEAFTTTPDGIDYEFGFARAAVDGEKLGGRGVTDLLAISVSSTDLIGHAFGVYSHETEDALLRADRALGEFLKFLDGRFGQDYVVVLTADHGATAPPEQSKKLGLGGERMKKAAIKDALTKALTAKYGAGEWVIALEDPSIYLNDKLIAEKKLDRAEVEQAAGDALLTVPGFAGYFTRSQLVRGWLPPTVAARAVARSFYPARSGDVIAVQAPFSFWGKYGEKDYGGSHGSFYRYDTDVPLLFGGAPFKPGRHGQAEMIDLAATLSYLLGVAPPAACEGEPLTRILR